jgi:hypothetical protein
MGLELGNVDGKAVLAALVASAAGFEGDGLVTAVAVAGAESSWNPAAVNQGASETPRGQNNCASWGLWQINVCPGRDDANPNRGAGNPQTLLDPYTNAQAAYAISSGGTNWQPWGAYTSGAHVKYIEKARTAVQLVGTESGAKAVAELRTTGQLPAKKNSGGGFSISIGGHGIDIPNPLDVGKGVVGIGTGLVGGALGIVKDPLDAIADMVRFVINPKNWLRVLAANVGIGLIVLGAVLIVADTKPELARAAGGAAVGAATGNPAAAAAAAK